MKNSCRIYEKHLIFIILREGEGGKGTEKDGRGEGGGVWREWVPFSPLPLLSVWLTVGY